MAIPVHVIPAAWEEHQAVLRQIREIVFIAGQQVPREIEWDGLDETSQHFLAVNELGEYIGCARLLDSGQIGRMAVLEAHRGLGVGGLLLKAVVDAAGQQGFERLFLHAQAYAEAFYRKGGFVLCGDPFEEAGITHVPMELKLPLNFVPALSPEEPRPAPNVIPQVPADRPSASPTPFSGLTDLLSQLREIAGSARRRLCILHPNLDQEIFEDEGLLTILSELARSAPRSEIQIIVLDTKLIVDRGHKVLELARRLDEKITIRHLRERANLDTSAFVCADMEGYWMLPNWQQFDGMSDVNNPVMCNRLLEAFKHAWEKSVDDPELRIIHI